MSDWLTTPTPLLKRFRFATMGAPDLDVVEDCYTRWLHYRVVERGTVAAELAQSWGTPAAAGAASLVMAPQNGGDVFLRVVKVPPVRNYVPLTTFGWNAIEIIVDDVAALADALAGGPFRILNGPAPLAFMPSIHAMQVLGPAQEVLYLTCETGDRDNSLLPKPASIVDRPFILVLGGPDFEAMHRWYVETFDLKQRPLRQSRAQVIADAQKLKPGETYPMTTVGLLDHGFLIEIDCYLYGPGRCTGPRPTPLGQFPSGPASISCVVDDLSRFEPLAVGPVVRPTGIGYAGHRACTLRGAAGELVELVESRT